MALARKCRTPVAAWAKQSGSVQQIQGYFFFFFSFIVCFCFVLKTGWFSGTHSLNQAGLELRGLLLPLFVLGINYRCPATSGLRQRHSNSLEPNAMFNPFLNILSSCWDCSSGTYCSSRLWHGQEVISKSEDYPSSSHPSHTGCPSPKAWER